MRRLVVLLLLALPARAEIVVHENAQKLEISSPGPFVRTSDRSILGATESGIARSRDEGHSWEDVRMFDPVRFQPGNERALLRTKDGVVFFAFLNLRERTYAWDQGKGGPQDNCRLPVYVSRSSDDGKTWDAPRLLQEGWSGAVRQMIQLKTDRILLVCQKALRNPGRHVTIVYASDDRGRTWVPSDPIDLGEYGGYGEQGSGLDGTILEKQDGGLVLSLRTRQGCFQEMLSGDAIHWTGNTPSTVEASDAPGMMLRLASGRVVMVWNRYIDPMMKAGGRQRLSIAFTHNDGVTWTVPQVLAAGVADAGAKGPPPDVSSPYVFESTPGNLWITTLRGGLRVSVRESDWLHPVRDPLDAVTCKIITLGDSITRGVRPTVRPNESFSALLQGALRRSHPEVQVHGVGIGFERTDLALRRLQQDVIEQRPDLVTIMYGTNDSYVDVGKVSGRITAEAYEANLREIVTRLRRANIQPVLMTEPMFGEAFPKNSVGENVNAPLGRFMDLCRKVATEMDVPLVDHFAGWAAAQKQGQTLQTWTSDGCHPNVAGHAEMAERMSRVLRPIIEQTVARNPRGPEAKGTGTR
ncbi:MAG: hypothetical protein EXS38_04650 [Opitutus sp.]|nr:hypothetical protein [Opitutus sp.]